MKTLIFVGAVVSLVVAVENYYEHPSYGTGLKALFAAIQAGEAL